MRTHLIFAAVLALSLAKDIGRKDDIEETDAEIDESQSIELLRSNREAKEDLDAAASDNYVPPSQRPPRPWNNQNFITNNPQNGAPNNYVLQHPNNNYIPNNNYNPYTPQNTWTNPQTFVPQNVPTAAPVNVFKPTQINNVLPVAPQNPAPVNPPQNVPVPTSPQNPQAPQNDYYVPQNSWTTTTPAVAVIQNDQYIGQNGDYKYEYQIADGTHVSEEGYLLNPNTDNESVVKKGWYSYTGSDGRIYTVTWWADHTGFHAFGDHLPTPPPTPPAIQAALDQAAKEEAEKNKLPLQPQPTQPPVYYPQQTYPQQNYPQQNYPQQTYPQQTYPQQTYPQQTNPQQSYYPPSYGK